jgi:hypothetical protein
MTSSPRQLSTFVAPLVVPFVVSLLLAVAPRTAAAQLTDWQLGPTVGYVYDESTDFIYFGGEARARVNDSPFQLQPRFTIQPASGVSVLQFDFNVLYDLALVRTNAILPYAGLGFVYQTITSGGSSAAGYNIIVGAKLTHVNGLVPFGQFEYSVLENHFPNQGALSVGVLFRL